MKDRKAGLTFIEFLLTHHPTGTMQSSSLKFVCLVENPSRCQSAFPCVHAGTKVAPVQ